MLKELKEEICKELMINNITENAVIKDYFNQRVWSYFYKLVGKESFKTPEDFLARTARSLAEKQFSKNNLNVNDIIVNSKTNIIYYELVNELKEIVPYWRSYSKVEDLVDDIAKELSNGYKPVVFNLDDVILTMINYNIDNGYKVDNVQDIERLIIKIFDYYFSGKTNVFTSEQGARKYILRRNKRQILEEMNERAKISSSLSIDDMKNSIIYAYAKSFSNTFIGAFYHDSNNKIYNK